MSKKYVSITISSINASFKSSGILYGPPGPLVFHSILNALNLKLDKSNINEGFVLTYLSSEPYVSNNAFKLKSIDRVTVKNAKSLLDRPEGYIKVNLIFSVDSDYSIDIIENDIIFNILKLRISGGMLNIEDINIESDINEIKVPFGFTISSLEEEFNNVEDFFIDSTIYYRGKKGIKKLMHSGFLILGDAGKENSFYNKEHYFGEAILEFFHFSKIKGFRMTKEKFLNYSLKTELIDNKFKIKNIGD